VYTLHSVYVRI